VGSTVATRRLALTGQRLDLLLHGIATFDLSLAGVKKDILVRLAAVVRAGSTWRSLAPRCVTWP
jgi:hypothetical protein